MYPVGSDEEAAGGVLVNSAFLTHHATDGIKFYQGLVLAWAYGYRTVAGGVSLGTNFLVAYESPNSKQTPSFLGLKR